MTVMGNKDQKTADCGHADSRANRDISPIQNLIYEIRGQKVMLDRDLAVLYEVEVKVLNQAVKRNMKRFPPDFMFKLKQNEWLNLRSQIVTAN